MSCEKPALWVKRLQVVRQTGFSVSLAELSIAAGGAAALVGPSGSGKTTLLLGMLGLLPAARCTGVCEIAGEPWPAAAAKRRRRLLSSEVCILNQDPKASLDPLQRIAEQIRGAALCAGRKPRSSDMVVALAELGIEQPQEILRRFPHQLSGGQCQRILLAIALLRRPTLLIADEPTQGLDATRQQEFVKALRSMRENFGTAVLVATHDQDLVEGLDAEPHCLVDGHVVPGWPTRPSWPHRAAGLISSEVLLECRGIGLSLGGRRILDAIDLVLHRGELLALVGPSGAGKTSLARVIAGHLAADQGGLSLEVPAEAVQLLYQDAFASMTPHMSVELQVEEVALEPFNIYVEAESLFLNRDRLEQLPADLSGGERRRSALLRALAVQPQVLILDEPTASLDRNTATAVMKTLLQVQQRHGMGVILISHDMELARSVADRIVVIEGGRI